MLNPGCTPPPAQPLEMGSAKTMDGESHKVLKYEVMLYHCIGTDTFYRLLHDGIWLLVHPLPKFCDAGKGFWAVDSGYLDNKMEI